MTSWEVFLKMLEVFFQGPWFFAKTLGFGYLYFYVWSCLAMFCRKMVQNAPNIAFFGPLCTYISSLCSHAANIQWVLKLKLSLPTRWVLAWKIVESCRSLSFFFSKILKKAYCNVFSVCNDAVAMLWTIWNQFSEAAAGGCWLLLGFHCFGMLANVFFLEEEEYSNVFVFLGTHTLNSISYQTEGDQMDLDLLIYNRENIFSERSKRRTKTLANTNNPR